MTSRARGRWLSALPITGAVAVLLAAVVWTFLRSAQFGVDGLVYALDDAYIHMALAKNLSAHGVFGATPFEFSPASSSPLWTLLLAGVFAVTGVHDAVPFALASVAAVVLLVLTDRMLARSGLGVGARLVTLVWIAIATPLVALIFEGMEHALQVLIDVALLASAAALVGSGDVSGRRGQMVWMAALSAAATAVRYEGVVVVGMVALAFAMRHRWRDAVLVSLAGAAPVIGWGLISMANGGFFLPNSVLVKSGDTLFRALITGGLPAYVAQLGSTWTTALPVYALLAASIGLLVLGRRRGLPLTEREPLFAALVAGVAIAHLSIGQVGWFFRYEAYLVALMSVGVAMLLARLMRERLVVPERSLPVALVAVLVLGSIVVGAERGVLAVRSTPRAMQNVYEQMYQTAHFLKANPQYDSVAIGDLGAVSYFNDDLRIVDLEGLAETEVPLTSLGRSNATAADIASLVAADGCDLAIVFPEYFDLPDDWIEVERWRISDNVVAYADTVAFLAIPPTDPVELARALQEYRLERLPATVDVEER